MTESRIGSLAWNRTRGSRGRRIFLGRFKGLLYQSLHINKTCHCDKPLNQLLKKSFEPDKMRIKSMQHFFSVNIIKNLI